MTLADGVHPAAGPPRPGASRRQNGRSLSLSMPWRRPRASPLPPADSSACDDAAVDGADDGHDNGGRRLKGLFRRVSVSFKGMVHRPSARTSAPTADGADGRPQSPHATWSRLREAAEFRHLRTFDDADEVSSTPARAVRQARPCSTSMLADEPSDVPTHAGAAAKASALVQNDVLLRQSLQRKWLQSPSAEDGNDRESGIGIAVNLPSVEVDDVDGPGAVPPQDVNISRLDFISLLPAELAIQIMAFLGATALVKASAVCRSWNRISRSQHIWRESCLRQMAGTFATGGPVVAGTGLGIPPVMPSNDWRRIYQARYALAQRWKGGKARPVYLSGHLDSIYCLQFDEHKIISGSRDKTIRVWDMHTLDCRLVIGPPDVIAAENLLRDEDGKASHYAMGAENVRESESTPSAISFPDYHNASILCLQYDDEMLVTGSSDATCIVYNVKTGYRPVRRLRHHTAAVLDLAFDKKHIVTCSKDISICVWDRATGALVRQLRGHTGPVNAVQMRGNTIVSCSGDFRVKLWNIDTGKNIREFVGHTKGLACSQFSDDGRYVASAGNDKVIRIWDANTGECVREMRAHDNLVRSLHIDSVSGRLVSGSYDSDIKVWDMETGHQLLDFPRWHASWVLSAKSDYRRIVSTGQDPKILIMDFGADVEGIESLESANGSRGFL
ncbi:WD40 repeat-like-containing domain protein [Drechmeria coniospora]|uniref:WD40 repeat-like-containing domain protein n=1 Tax=Drechmeria coniospora TaxID=98403 RepID=A0A151GHC9_DRECN|nr:WD40 repeat-like-containing domain protein [Drechmeria coniospora]KYK56442.1 WD40 repeat-like-containing domain protein [Drechmeria coniospora]ODA76887.1 hypothetical protein RJ55_07403 [Drechmeria coniospora]